MAEERWFNLCYLVIGELQLPLRLENDFELTAGIEPNINTAIVPFGVYDLLAALPRPWRGSLRLYARPQSAEVSEGTILPAEADVTIEGIAVVEVEQVAYGRTWPQAIWRVLEYRLHLADVRERFQLPKGGTVSGGQINTSPIDEEGLDANKKETKTARSLVEMCLAAMGITATLPEEFEDGPIIPDLNWRGAHAPAELAKILDRLGYIFIPKLDGTFSIEVIGEGPGIAIPDDLRMAHFDLPGSDRRGRNVLFTSAPNGIIVSHPALKGPGPAEEGQAPTVELVVWLPDLGWVNHEEAFVSTFAGKPLFDHLKENFENFPSYAYNVPGEGLKRVDLRPLMRRLAFRCIRVTPPEAIAAEGVLAQLNLAGKALQKPQIRAIIASQGSSYYWHNSEDPVLCAITHLGDSNVYCIEEVLTKLSSSPSTNPDADAAELAYGDLEVTTSWELIDAQTKEPKYFEIAYTSDPVTGAVTELPYPPPDSVRVDPNTIIVNEPGWVLVREVKEDGTFHEPTLAKLKEVAQAAASRYLARSNAPARRHLARGFFAQDLSGRVSRVVFSQSKLQTEIDELTWWMPRHMNVLQPNAGRFKGQTLLRRDLLGDTNQTQALRRAANAPDQALPAVPVLPAGGRRQTAGIAWLEVISAARDEQNWRWTYTLKLLTPPTSAFAAWAQGAEVEGYNTIEHANDDDDEGVQSGIDLSVEGIAGIEPVHVGAVVPAWPHTFPGDEETDPETVYFFTYPNAPAIDCEEA
jgi:hypothetical protein